MKLREVPFENLNLGDRVRLPALYHKGVQYISELYPRLGFLVVADKDGTGEVLIKYEDVLNPPHPIPWDIDYLGPEESAPTDPKKTEGRKKVKLREVPFENLRVGDRILTDTPPFLGPKRLFLITEIRNKKDKALVLVESDTKSELTVFWKDVLNSPIHEWKIDYLGPEESAPTDPAT